MTAHGRPRQGGVVAGRSLAIGEAAGDRDRPGPGGAGAPGRGGLAGAAAAGPGRHRPLMGRSGCVGARCRRVDGRDAGRIPPDRAAAPVALLSAGFMGRLAGRLMSRVSPAVVQRLLDLLLGARCSPRWPGDGTRCTARPSMGRLRAGVDRVLGRRRFCRSVHPEWPGHDEPRRGRRRWPLQAMGPAGAGPTPRRSAAPLPPWLGGRAVQRGAQSRRRGWRDRGARAQQQPRHLGSAWASPGAGRPKGCSTATASAWCPRAERPFRILRLPWQSDGASTGRQLFQASPAIPANLHGAGPGVGVPGYMLQPLDISRRRTTRTPSG